MSAHQEFQSIVPGNLLVRDGAVHLVSGPPAKFKVESGGKVGGKTTFKLNRGESLPVTFKDDEFIHIIPAE
jgi:hypothetical protein